MRLIVSMIVKPFASGYSHRRRRITKPRLPKPRLIFNQRGEESGYWSSFAAALIREFGMRPLTNVQRFIVC
jgi:hypothetical protein